MGLGTDTTDTGGIMVAVLDGGPMDGRTHAVESGVSELRITMADGTRHLYERTEEFGPVQEGGIGPIFRWKGRF